jgi:hypothetical protein
MVGDIKKCTYKRPRQVEAAFENKGKGKAGGNTDRRYTKRLVTEIGMLKVVFGYEKKEKLSSLFMRERSKSKRKIWN